LGAGGLEFKSPRPDHFTSQNSAPYPRSAPQWHHRLAQAFPPKNRPDHESYLEATLAIIGSANLGSNLWNCLTFND
jgi:hypothetical protein